MSRILSSPLSKSFAMVVILAGTVITSVVTVLQLWFDYREDLQATHKVLDQIERSFVSSIANSLWNFDEVQTQSQINGIASLREIEFVEIVADGGSRWSAGRRFSTHVLEHRAPLVRYSGQDTQNLGVLIITTGVDSIYFGLIKKFFVLFFLNSIKAICMSVFIIVVFYQMVGRHLVRLAGGLSTLNITSEPPEFELARRLSLSRPDELDLLSESIRSMYDRVSSSYAEVTSYRDNLECTLHEERKLTGLQTRFVNMVSQELCSEVEPKTQRSIEVLTPAVGSDHEDISSKIQRIRQSVQSLTAAMDRTALTSNLGDGELRHQPGKCRIVEVLNDVCEEYVETATDREILRDFDELPVVITADPERLRQVFSILLSNAIKYSPNRQPIRIAGNTKDRGYVEVAVSDHGVGIPEQEQKDVFTRFFKASTSSGISGTGLGLHLAKRLVELHDGRITFESQPSNGTTFFVKLPVGLEVPPDDGTAPEPENGPYAAAS